MRRYLLGAALSALIAASVLAVPAGAAASPVLEYGSGGKVPVGAPIAASSTNLAFSGGNKVISCAENALGGTATVNSGAEVVTEFSSASFTGNSGPSHTACSTLGFGEGWSIVIDETNVPWCLSSTVFGTASLKPCGSKPLSMRMRAYSGSTPITGACTFTATELPAQYKAGGSFAVAFGTGSKITRQPGSGLWCPASWSVEGGFHLTSEGKEVKIS
jgi:hypothetical protein